MRPKELKKIINRITRKLTGTELRELLLPEDDTGEAGTSDVSPPATEATASIPAAIPEA